MTVFRNSSAVVLSLAALFSNGCGNPVSDYLDELKNDESFITFLQVNPSIQTMQTSLVGKKGETTIVDAALPFDVLGRRQTLSPGDYTLFGTSPDGGVEAVYFQAEASLDKNREYLTIVAGRSASEGALPLLVKLPETNNPSSGGELCFFHASLNAAAVDVSFLHNSAETISNTQPLFSGAGLNQGAGESSELVAVPAPDGEIVITDHQTHQTVARSGPLTFGSVCALLIDDPDGPLPARIKLVPTAEHHSSFGSLLP